MPRPPKYDRVSKLVAYETGFIPIELEESKAGVMHITFKADEVSQEDFPTIREKLQKAIPLILDIAVK